MKIKKISGTAILDGNVVDGLEDNSTTNAPSQRAVNEALKKLDEYSTKEKVVGIWVDGKPLYRKVFVITGFSANVEGSFSLGVSNLKEIVNLYGNVNDSSFSVPINFVKGAFQNSIHYTYSSGLMVYQFYQGTTAYIIVEYTKTED